MASQTSCVTKAQDPQDSFSLLAVCDSEGAQNSSSTQSINRIQTKVTSFTAFTRVQKANRLEKRREVCVSYSSFEHELERWGFPFLTGPVSFLSLKIVIFSVILRSLHPC